MFKLPAWLKTRLTIIILIVILIIAAIAIWFANRNSNNQQRIITEQISRGTIAKTVSLSGNVAANKKQTVQFGTTDTVTNVYVKPGDKVKQGQELAKIDITDLDSKLTQAAAQLNQARNDLNNTYLKGKYTTYDIASLNEKIHSAEASYNSAKAAVDAATARAEFNGVVISATLQPGGAAGTNSIVVIDPSSLYLDVSLTEYDLVSVKDGMNATIVFDSLNSKSYLGKLTEIDSNPSIQSNVVSYKAKVAIVANDGQLNLGYSGKATITLQSKDNVLLATTAAVHTKTDGTNYLIAIENGNQVEKTVQTGLVGDTQTEITSGINEGEEILVSIVQPTTATTSSSNQPNIQFFGGGTFRQGTVNRTGR